jgi:hypothetical protein
MLDRSNDIFGVASTLGRICQACRWTPCTASTLMVRRSLSYLGSRSTTTPQSASHAPNYLFLSISPSLQTTIVAVDSDRHQASDQETASEMHRHRQPSTSRDRDPWTSLYSNITARLCNLNLRLSLYTLSRVPATVDITWLRKRHLGSAETRMIVNATKPFT